VGIPINFVGSLIASLGKTHGIKIVATLALACNQGKGVARCGHNSRPGITIVQKEKVLSVNEDIDLFF
jgi:hypothetical protein